MTGRLNARRSRVKEDGYRDRSLLAVLPMLIGAGAFGQGSDARNAAVWYEKAFERLSAISISDDERQALYRYELDSGAAPGPEVRATLARLQPVFSAVRRGSRQPFSDFELDYSQGIDLTLPHLNELRTIARLMSKDAIVRMYDGETLAAADDMAAIYRVAGHLADDGVIISSLVGQSIFRTADRVAGSGLDRGAFSPLESERLLAALKQLEGRDPFDITGAIGSEREWVLGWIRQEYGDPGDRAEMLDDLSLNLGVGAELAGLALLDDAQFEAELEQTDQLMGRVMEVFALEDPEEAQFELKRLADEIGRGGHGALAMVLVPHYGKLLERMTEAQEQIDLRTAQMHALVSGDIAPQRFANAAVWYLRAIGVIERLSPVARAQLREVVADPMLPVDEAAVQTLAESEAIVEALRQASAIRRCDFKIAPGGDRAVPAYPAGLRESARLLQADAIRLLEQEEAGPAVERLVICYRMAAQLAGDSRLASSLVAHTVFAETTALAVRYLEVGALSSAHRQTLLEAATLMSRRDPFGYVAARAEAIKRLIEWVDGLGLDDHAERQARASIRRLDGDQLFYALVIATAPDANEEPVQFPDGFDGVIEVESLSAGLADAGAIEERIIESGTLRVLLDQPAPEIGHIRGRRSTAPADFRRAQLALAPAPE